MFKFLLWLMPLFLVRAIAIRNCEWFTYEGVTLVQPVDGVLFVVFDHRK